MRAFVLALIGALSTAALATTAQAAAWQDRLLGQVPSRVAPVTRQKKVSTTRRIVRTKRTRRTARRYQRSKISRLGVYRSQRSTRRRAASRRSYRGRTLSGLASYYWQPQRVASGGWFNPNALTAAHKSLPFGTRVRVTNLRNGRSVVVRINDRGPYIRGRIIDLSRRAAGIVGMRKSGVVPVRVQVL